jgi:outer membrane receptor protein involved in Fe transport
MKLIPENNELKDHVVKSGKVTNTENSVINEIKTSATIVSGTSASQISKSLDRNAADVVKRIPGVTVQDDRFIVVRGLPERYNTVWLNDASTPSSEVDKKAFSFDIIPAGLIDRVLVFKTPSPELPGDFAGGMVKVFTTSLADKNSLSVNLSTSSREFSTGTNFNYNAPSSTDALGYNDGSRNIPGTIPGKINNSDPNYKNNISAWSRAFSNDWAVKNKTAGPDARFSLALSNVWKLKNIKIGNTLGLAYTNSSTNITTHRQDWIDSARDYNYYDKRSSNNVSVGLMDNIGVAIGNTKLEFKTLYNQIGVSSLTERNTVPDSTNISQPIERAYAMGYESRATYATQLAGTHKNNKDTRKYNWTLGYTDLFRNQPDLKRIKFVEGADSVFKAQISSNVDPVSGGGRFFATLYEKTYSFNHQFTQKVKVNDNFSFDVSAGNYLEYKERNNKFRQFGYIIKSGQLAQTLTKLPIDQIFADSVGGVNTFRIGEATNDYDEYTGKNKLIASYVSLKLPITKQFTVVGGARYEMNTQSIITSVNYNAINLDVDTKFLLPSVNASYNFTDKSLVRAAYGKTLNRPEFREWAPIFFYDFDELAGTKGSLFPTTVTKNINVGDTLKVAEVQNFDLRYELYPSSGELIQVGAFYKSFKNPIQRVIIPGSSSGDSRAYTFINASEAYCYGVELDLRKNLGTIDQLIGTDFFKDFTLVSNLSLAKSEMQIDTSVVKGGIPKATIQGQSQYVVNAGVYYQSLQNGFQGSLLYNVFGSRLYALGTNDVGGESIGELPFQSLDLTVSKTIRKHYILNFGIQNLLGSRVSFVKDVNNDNKFDSKNDRDFRSFYPGRYYTVGIKLRF